MPARFWSFIGGVSFFLSCRLCWRWICKSVRDRAASFVRAAVVFATCATALLVSSVTANAQDSPADSTINNPEAKVAFERGMNSVKLGAWSAAVDAFLEAREKEGRNPIIYFNLGLAFKKANQPLPAAMFFQAYLAQSPKASNANDIRNEIAGLEKASAAKFASIMKTMESTAATLQGKSKQKAKLEAYMIIAKSYASAGDMDNALAAARGASSAGHPQLDLRPVVWLTYAAKLAYVGSAKKAQEVSAMVERTFPPIPSNYNADAKLDYDVRNSYFERENLIGSIQSWLKDQNLLVNDPWFVLNRISYFSIDFRKAMGANLEVPPEFDLDGGISRALYRYNNPRSFKSAEDVKGDLLGFLQLNIRNKYQRANEITKIATGGQVLGGDEVALIAAMGAAIAGGGMSDEGYGSLMLKYQYLKELFAK